MKIGRNIKGARRNQSIISLRRMKEDMKYRRWFSFV
jgi:hypothetical protein